MHQQPAFAQPGQKRFTVTGDGYEYLRLTSALHRLADAAREIA